MRISTASSNAKDSAQPISLLLALHTGMRDHAYHAMLKMMLMPQLDEALTHMSGSMVRWGLREWEQLDLAKTASHQCRLAMMELGVWWEVKSLGNLERNAKKGGRVELPSL